MSLNIAANPAVNSYASGNPQPHEIGGLRPLPLPQATDAANLVVEPLKVLLVEDDPILIRLMSRRLQSDGHVVQTALDCQKAWEVLELWRPDLIVLDFMIPPYLDSQPFMRSVRANPRYRDLPMIVASGLSDAGRVASTFGANFLPKPFDTKTLIQVVRETIGPERLSSSDN